jgi:hypothetical protein
LAYAEPGQGPAAEHRGKGAPDERQQRNLLTRGCQLLRHLKCDSASGAVSDDHVWTMGLITTDLLDFITRELLHRLQGLSAVKARGLYAKHRLFSIQMASHSQEIKDISAVAGHGENGSPRTPRLDRH